MKEHTEQSLQLLKLKHVPFNERDLSQFSDSPGLTQISKLLIILSPVPVFVCNGTNGLTIF